MATDFFERQSSARRSTMWLAVMFCLAVVGIVGIVCLVTAIVVTQQTWIEDPGHGGDFPWQVPLVAAVATLLLIGGGTLYKVVELRAGGGTGVAERLGGNRLYPDTTEPAHRQLLNIVEEMAIASGTPVPPVFVLKDEQNINAFAAGYSPSDAVLGVTQGCCEKMSRDELQGVIAHEFSHILNGDMRMSIRLIGILHGILLLGLTGQLVFRMLSYSGGRGRSRRDSNSGGVMIALLLIALTLVVVGFIGTFFGNIIKAAVSRQREYLADASAVQFTRNPEGLAGALKRIGGAVKGARLVAPGATEASHMFFAQGVWEGITGLWATHPPLKKRILAIDPQWNGQFAESDLSVAAVTADQASGLIDRAALAAGEQQQEVPVAVVDNMAEQVGEPTRAHQEYAAKLLAAIPDNIVASAREPYGARAVMYCLLLDRNAEVRTRQFETLVAIAEPDVVKLTHQLVPHVDQLDVRARLPLVDLALPALRALSPAQYHSFSRCFDKLVQADDRLELFEWVLSQVLMWHLRPQFETVRSPRVQYYALHRLSDACSILLSTVACAGNTDPQAAAALAAGARQFPELEISLKPRSECGLSALRNALSTLTKVVAKHRGRLVDACADSICADGHVSLEEGELLRGISDLLDCPMPPLLAGQDL